MADYYWPNGTLTKPKVASPFGPRKAPGAGASTNHKGVDLIGFRYNRSITDGTVVKLGTPKYWEGGGIQVWVRNWDGSLARYFHNAIGSINHLKIGQKVKAKDILGIAGQTGVAFGVHLHLEIVPKGKTAQVDPIPYIQARLATTAGTVIPSKPSTTIPEEEDMAKNSGGYYTRKADKVIVYMIWNTDSGYVDEYSQGKPSSPMPAAYNNAVAVAYGTGNYASITESHAGAIKRSCAMVRPKDVVLPDTFRIVSEDEIDDTIKAAAYHAAQAENESVPLVA